jgi:hypothetical protein
MRRVTIILVVLVIGFGLGVRAQGVGGFYDGNKYLAKPEMVKLGYITGVSDAYNANFDQTDLVKFQRCTKGMTNGQIQAIAEKCLKDKPQFRHDQMASTIWMAVIESCPQ